MKNTINPRIAKQFIGIKRHKLTPVKYIGKSNCDQIWLFKCDCGGSIKKLKTNFMRSNCNNCGCAKPQKLHGFSHRDKNGHRSPLYLCWVNMRQRCTNKKRWDYKFYGGRGITFCEKWSTFKGFFDDMNNSYLDHKKKFKDTSLDRIDVNKDYCKENCKWSTRFEQSNNRNYNRLIEYKGKKQSAGKWVKELKLHIKRQELFKRIFTRKWPIERAMTQKYGDRFIVDRWSVKYAKCVKCETTKTHHQGYGLCNNCYQVEKRNINSSFYNRTIV